MIGRSLADGRFEVSERIAGDDWWGLFHAQEVPGGGRCLVTTATAPRDRERDAFEAALVIAAPGIAPLLYHGSVSELEHPHYVLVEREPAGSSLADWAAEPVSVPIALEIIGGLARTVQVVHDGENQPLGGLHPRVIYVDDGRFSGCAPRFRRLHERAATEFKRPLFEPTFEARETLLGGRRVPSSDIFSLCSLLVWLTTGVAPFGSSVLQEVGSVQRRVEPLTQVPAALGEVVRQGLAHDDAARPPIDELVAALDV